MGRPPYNYNGFTGQKRVITYLQRAATNTFARNDVTGPFALVGPTGCGKTALVETIANGLKVGCKKLIATKDMKLDVLIRFFESLNFANFAFIDEAHNLNRSHQEICYQVIDNWTIQRSSFDKKTGQQKCEKVSVTRANLIFGTDQPGAFEKAFNRRLNPIQMDDYSVGELKKIIADKAAAAGASVSAQAAGALAHVSKGSPGEGAKLLKSLADWLEEDQRSVQISETIVREFLDAQGIDRDTGLTTLDRQYLRILKKIPNGHITLNHLSSHLRYDANFILNVVEPYLIRDGYLEISSRGRELTQRAEIFLNELEKKEKQDESEDRA